MGSEPHALLGLHVLDHSETLSANVVEASGAVVAALLAGENYPTREDGRSAVATLAAAYVSDESGHVGVDPSSSSLPKARVFPWA